jgi:hypothetical protein
MIRLAEGSPLAWYQSRGLGFNPPDHAFSSAARNNSHLPCCSLSTHMALAHGRDSHAGGGMLEHTIRAPPPPYHLGFMVGLARGSRLAKSTLMFNEEEA